EIAAWNRGAERMTGYSAEEIVGRHFSLFYPPAEIARGLPARVLEQARDAGRFEHQSRHVRKDGSGFLAEVVITPIVDGEARLQGFATITRDVTERHLLEEQMRQAQKLEAVGRLAGGVAHDFNNLLTIILGYCNIMSAKLGPDHGATRDLSELEKAATRATKLTGQLLAFSRKQVLKPEVLDVNAIVNGVA